jgi:FkbM family methyltransferase
MKDFIQKLFNSFGYQISKYPSGGILDLRRRMLLLNHFSINKILDVGANKGQYASTMRKLGFKGEIISFEPMKQAFTELKKASSSDSLWTAENFALGATDSEAVINIAGNSISSSLFNMLPSHLKAAPGSGYIGTENIIIKKLDSVFPDHYKNDDSIFLKIDVQGYEKNVLDGAEQSLDKIEGIQLEMSLVHLYEGGILFAEMMNFLETKGYKLFSIENGFTDYKTGRLLSVDGIFFKAG